ncbi:PIN domain-containing protein [Nocardia sp. NPDC052566]|uniref:PIN domain-containing protein n=1 Tax=Nocardia sp. NPDC052566 TaxID=3364330 RepID=UPI0037CA9B99
MVSGRGTKVLVDANVFYSRTLRDWLALLYLHGCNEMFEVMWTDDIMAEFHYHLRKNNPFLADAQVGGIRRRLERLFQSGRIIGFTVDPSGEYPDVGDAHVHCAAVHGQVDILLTGNTKHFREIDDLPYEIYTPDEFFELVDDSAPNVVLAVTKEQLVYHCQMSSRGSGVSLPEMLKKAGAPVFAERVRQHLHSVDINALLGVPLGKAERNE